MEEKQYSVLIIEDDFRVANINKELVEKIDNFQVCRIAHSGKEALAFLKETDNMPHIILLDVYIPDVEGLELMWEIRKKYQTIDIIMITAAKEIDTIEETLRGGIFDYLIKPIDFERLKLSFEQYREKQQLFSSKQEMSQEELDRLRGLIHLSRGKQEEHALPKGIDRLTLDKVFAVLKGKNKTGFTAMEVGKLIGASRSTARRYLEYLVATKEVKAELIYGDVGRPERRYTLT